jgi:NarL family two-component system response regulator LiaR
MTVIIVDDDALICRSLELVLSKEPDIEVLGTAATGSEAVQLCKRQTPDVVLMDIRMPEMDGIQATRLIKQFNPEIKVVMLTTFQDRPNIAMALKAGAEGYLLKTDKIANIPNQLRVLYSGTSVLDSTVLKTLATPDVPALSTLTPRERDVLDLVAQGRTNKEIAEKLFLSDGTVRNLVSVIMEKLEAKNRTHLSFLVQNTKN